ncbi:MULTISPECIES: hypothetical protein [Aeromonas]|jgi:hypothetical protein|uniref:hypothetical protein n=1 Tax=Aeromonas TaxID=642 RepID=UPI000DF7F2E1|nr:MULTISPECIES: hypothetical protein [Aeromonas]MBA8782492.1 hypothetical protein [Aeromonas caviae]MBA8786547.1 hypothetical protein [Aeromonas sp. TW 6]QQQ15850.1 hypothetical protein JJL53_24095 [Aeromonas media]RDD50688.1 hypothetical protein ASJ36_07700 [Aeromonas sp. ARM81]
MAVAVKEVSPEATGAVVSGETLMKHFHSCVQEFDDHFQKSRLGESHLRFREIIALGGVHQIYWLMLGAGAVNEAKEVATWWEQNEYRHRQGRCI